METPKMENQQLFGFVLNCQPFPNTNNSLMLITVEKPFFQKLQKLIPNDPNGLVFFKKGVQKIIIHAPETILSGLHKFSVDPNTPKVSYLAEFEQITIIKYNANPGDRVVIVGKRNNGAFGKFVKYSGKSIVVQIDEGEKYNPSPNSVKLVKPKYRSKIEKTKENNEILSVKKILPMKKESVPEDYSDVDIEKNDKIPAGNYDVIPEKFRKLLKYLNVSRAENFTDEVYARMKCAEKLFVHIDARKSPEIIKHTNWITKVNAYMKETGYNDPRLGTLISKRSSRYYELWECPGGFDFMRFAWSILNRNAGVKYGHMCHISIILDNTCYKVILFM